MSNLILSEPERNALIRDHFSRAAQRPGIYLANHSLGRPLDQLPQDLLEYADLWFNQMDNAWEPWLAKIEEFQTLVAELLHHPRKDGVIPKTSAGQALRAVLNAFPKDQINIVTTTMEFVSIDFILKTYQSKGKANLTSIPPNLQEGPVPLIDPQDILNAITPETDLVVLSQIVFTTGQIIPQLEEIIEKAHANQAYVLLDTYHSFGVIPLHFQDLDFAIGGSYKYIHGGPGACWLAVSSKILETQELKTLDTGWFAKANLFGYQRNDERAQDGRAWWESTPPVITAYQAVSGLKFIQKAGLNRLRATSLHQQEELRQTLSQHQIPVFQPQDPTQFGGFSLLPTDNPTHVVQELKARNISVDARGNFVRFCPDILNTSEDFDVTAKALQEILNLA